ncbi:hypothetical protein P4S81_03470 [Pseudoalteromonas sp. B28]|uniref:hypothetical protein n=1 Tax=Pseudoalteromonas sp. SR41-7 TaxID=2760947 RepID=UPI0015FFFFF2|nr:hypothetical protein [Pseudoalteromonas sp. SR41-7]MBB1298743.1 hypothetical protein [Pseudoalteromonas sp. SR41-7]|tara:strand:+ start:8 stop:829 length:822 start_codon:yes stop_codon:yes gene_type:complete
MNWNQFGYICRVKSSKTLSTEQKLQLCSESHLQIYKDNGSHSELAHNIAWQIAEDEETSQKQTACYKNIPDLINEFKFEHKGWLIYLTAVFIIYCFTSQLYQSFVVPQFVEMYSSFSPSLSATFDYYLTYWYVPIMLLALLLIIIVMAIIKLKNASSLTTTTPFSGMYNILLPRRLRNEYDALIAIIEFPYAYKKGFKATTAETIHFEKCESLGLELNDEFTVLLKQKLMSFNAMAKSYINKLVILYGIVIVVSVYLFVKMAYQPIFMMGEVL